MNVVSTKFQNNRVHIPPVSNASQKCMAILFPFPKQSPLVGSSESVPPAEAPSPTGSQVESTSDSELDELVARAMEYGKELKKSQEEKEKKMDQNDVEFERCLRSGQSFIRCYNLLRESPYERSYGLPLTKAIEYPALAVPRGFCKRFYWEVPSISEQRKQALKTPIVSPSWFSQHGYHLRLYLFLNGHGRCFGSHVSVFMSILPGPFDKFLKWPAIGNTSFFILDHQFPWARTRCLDRDAFPQPTQTISEVNAAGCYNFMELCKLDNYVKNNTLLLALQYNPPENYC